MNTNTHTFYFTLYFYIENMVLWARSEIDGSALEFCV
jgi:hypothetical protein